MRSQQLIQQLQLQAHPEGGWYRRSYTSPMSIRNAQGIREALSCIYYLLQSGERSSLHQVDCDEAWHFYEGDALQLTLIAPDLSLRRDVVLGPLTSDQQPQWVVPAGWWQGARPLGKYSLVGCSVAPAFDFSGFRLLRQVPEQAAAILSRWPDLSPLADMGGDEA